MKNYSIRKPAHYVRDVEDDMPLRNILKNISAIAISLILPWLLDDGWGRNICVYRKMSINISGLSLCISRGRSRCNLIVVVDSDRLFLLSGNT
jgi:hypothetical protein